MINTLRRKFNGGEGSGCTADAEIYPQAIGEVWRAMEKYNPAVIGYQWDEENPRIQLEPRGERGYMELKAVKKKV